MTSYDRRGTGAPLVLVHGLGSRWQVFEPVLERLAEHREVISVDLPGFGESPSDPAVRPGPHGYAEWLAGFLQDLGVERPHVAGNSMGGGVALELGRSGVASRVTAFAPIGFWRRPGRLWTQGLLGGMRGFATSAPGLVARLNHSTPTRAATLAPFFGRPWKVSEQAARLSVAGLVGAEAFPDARASFSDYTWTEADDPGALTTIPVTVAWGTRDVTLVHRTQSRRARTLLPFARHVDLPGCGHLPFNDDPELCTRILLEDL